MTLDELAAHVPDGRLYRSALAGFLDDGATMLNLQIVSGLLPDPSDHATYAAGPGADVLARVMVMLAELHPGAPERQRLAAAHGLTRLAVALVLLQAADKLEGRDRLQ